MNTDDSDRQADPPPGQEFPETTGPPDHGMVDRLKSGTQLAVQEEWLRRKIDDRIPASLVANLKRKVRLELDGARIERQKSNAALSGSRIRWGWLGSAGVIGAAAAAVAFVVMSGQPDFDETTASSETPYIEVIADYVEDDFTVELAAIEQLVLEMEQGWSGSSLDAAGTGLDDFMDFIGVESEAADG